MPGFNQMGPENKGPMTGRGMGRCARNETSEEPSRDFWGGGRRCRRGGRGQGRFRNDGSGRGRE